MEAPAFSSAATTAGRLLAEASSSGVQPFAAGDQPRKGGDRTTRNAGFPGKNGGFPGKNGDLTDFQAARN